jgi:Ca2+-dependent lipid-binding protein
MVFGTVIIKPTSALLTGHKEMFDKIDPFVKVYFGGDYQKTDVAKNMGANPIWNNEFCFKNVDLEKNVIRFEVFDKNLIKSSCLGCCEYALGNLL